MGNRLYVGNLGFNTTESALRDAAAAHGTVLEVKIVLDRETGQSRGFGFVNMSSDDEARLAISALNGTMLDGRALRVSEAAERPPRSAGGGERRGNRW